MDLLVLSLRLINNYLIGIARNAQRILARSSASKTATASKDPRHRIPVGYEIYRRLLYICTFLG